MSKSQKRALKCMCEAKKIKKKYKEKRQQPF